MYIIYIHIYIFFWAYAVTICFHLLQHCGKIVKFLRVNIFYNFLLKNFFRLSNYAPNKKLIKIVAVYKNVILMEK